MKEKLQALNDQQLIDLANELTKSELPENALARQIIGESSSKFYLHIIELTAHLVQVMAERLKGCSPHLVK